MGAEGKTELRQRILSQRRALSSNEVVSLSGTIVQRFLQSDEINGLKGVEIQAGIYRGIHSEVEIQPLEPLLTALGWRLFYPRIVNRQSKELEFVEISDSVDHDMAFRIGPYGIQEPHPDLKAIQADSLNVIVVPGVVFGPNGERIGMGKGYYDRFLENNPRALRVSFAYDFQIVDRLEQDTWDQPVDWLLTEKRVFKTSRFYSWWKDRGLQ